MLRYPLPYNARAIAGEIARLVGEGAKACVMFQKIYLWLLETSRIWRAVVFCLDFVTRPGEECGKFRLTLLCVDFVVVVVVVSPPPPPLVGRYYSTMCGSDNVRDEALKKAAMERRIKTLEREVQRYRSSMNYHQSEATVPCPLVT